MEKIFSFILLLQQELEVPFKNVTVHCTILKLCSSLDDDLVNKSKNFCNSLIFFADQLEF